MRVRDPQVTGVAWHDEVLLGRRGHGRRLLDATRCAWSQRRACAAPPAGIDPALAQVDFSFKVDCPSDFDCQPRRGLPARRRRPRPAIDYLAQDYASFRRLMLDRLSMLMPDWRERNPADLGVALVELLAFRGDELSYYQDAVATEAYLGTARRRVSVRRHARLVDYALHDGCNARAWVAFEADGGRRR